MASADVEDEHYAAVSSSSESEFSDDNSEDLSYLELCKIPDYTILYSQTLKALQIDNNLFDEIPDIIGSFTQLISLDVSNNQIVKISAEICKLYNLRTFTAKNNALTCSAFPKDFGTLDGLEVVNVSGNHFTDLPIQFTELRKLRYLYMGCNSISRLPEQVQNMMRLEILYLGGNCLTEIPPEVGYIQNLTSLVLSDNKIHSLPTTLINLRHLRSLSLHNNCLATLPPQIVAVNLVELSLRDNPLVVKFVQDMVYNPPSLLELSGRTVLVERLPYTDQDIPRSLCHYLNSAHSCINPKCRGVYFSSRAEHVKFVDFCGKYRLPLMQYLCSPVCTAISPRVQHRAESESDDDDDEAELKMRKVLLG